MRALHFDGQSAQLSTSHPDPALTPGQGEPRLQRVRVDLKDPVDVADGPIRLIDHLKLERGPSSRTQS